MQTRVEVYHISLKIDAQRHFYTGKVKIELDSDDGAIKLDSVDLSIKEARLDDKAVSFELDDRENRISIKASPGKHILDIDFTGNIPRLLTGLYTAKYPGGEIFTTQLESTGARRVFPCIDEPSAKAKFRLELEIDSELEAISNMPVSSISETGNNKKLVKFEETPRMSTYLLYIGVGKFDSVEQKTGDISVFLIAPKGTLTKSLFPLDVATRVIELFQDYFGIPYVLPKVHLISVPEFAAGAMENWGAITFREIYLSIDESTSSGNFKSIAEVIAHELAHQWFGNLVTMKWWNDLWLNESFATFMAFKMVDRTHPEWEFINRLLQSETSGALTGDSLSNSHPIDADVKNPDDIAQIFDEISYGKGASILRMIETYVGEDNFREGIRRYLKKYQYGNAMGSDLWSSIEEASGMPVSRIMEAWVKRKGYPYVEASRNGEELHIRQTQFMLDKKVQSQPWPLPLNYRTGEGDGSLMFDREEMSLKARDAFTLNRNASGFYRVLYDDSLRNEITGHLSSMSRYERWGFLNDAKAFLSSGALSFDSYMEILKKYSRDTDPMIIREMSSQLVHALLISDSSARLNNFASDLSTYYMEALGEKKNGENPNISIARGGAFQLKVLSDSKFGEKLSERGEAFFSVDPDIRGSLATSVGLTNPELLFKLFLIAKTDEDRVKIISGMSWTQDGKYLDRALGMIADGSIKRQDAMRFYISCAHSRYSRHFMLENLEKSILQLREMFVGSRTPARVLEEVIPFIGLDHEKETRQMLERFKTDDLKKGVAKGLELLAVNQRIKQKIK